MIVLTQASASFSWSELGWEFANMTAAAVFLFLAFAAIALFCFRRGTRDPTLIYFALFCLLYGLRVLAYLPFFRSLFNESPTFWNYLALVISNILFFPGALFLYQVVSESFRRFLRWLLAARALIAAYEISAAALGVSLAKLSVTNNIKVLATLVATLVFVVATRLRRSPRARLSHEIRVLVAGFVIWLLFILHANLVGLNFLRARSGEVFGCLVFVACLGYVSARRTFANEERLLAINKELEIAHNIQCSILPQKIPTFRGLDIVARYAPMSAVAGDFYDFLCIDERRVGVLVADVTGHGVPAALIASMLKVAFAGQAAHAHDPARVLDGLNRSLCGKFESHFVTAAYVFVDL